MKKMIKNEKMKKNEERTACFHKGYSVQNCFLVMLENFNEFLDKTNEFGALLINISKAFKYIDPRFLILVGVSVLSLNLMCFHLFNQNQRIKIKTSYSDICNTDHGTPEVQFYNHYYLTSV